jgi:hypothetical protein
MRNKISLIAFACAGLLLAACTRSVTGASLPTATEDPLSSVFNTIATQTALAAGGSKSLTATPTSLFGATSTLASSPTVSPTMTTTPAPVTNLPVPNNYKLHEGEWPYCLARRFNILSSSILEANGLTEQEAENLSVGYKLVIPVDDVGTYGPNRQLRTHPTTYTASGADTFYSIACAFGDVWPEHIAEANGMELDDNIKAGMLLHIP